MEHEVPPVARRHQDALLSVQAQQLTAAEIAFDLLVDAAHRQDLAVLVDRARDRNALTNRHIGQTGQQGIKLRTRCRIAFNTAVLLLEHHRRIQGQGRDVREQGRQMAVQNQHAFVMDRPGQLDLAFDVEQAVFARIRACGHTHRKAKAVVPQVHHRQTIELGHALATHLDQTLAIGNGFEQTLLRVIQSPPACAQRGLHIIHLHKWHPAPLRPLAAFHHQGFGQGKQRALPALVLGLPVCFFDECRHRLGCKMQQALALAHMRHKDRRGPRRLGRGHKALHKIHLATKSPRKLRVCRLHRVVLVHRSHQHHLDLHIHRLGLQRNRRHRRVHHARLLNLQTATAHEAAQLLPDRLIGQQVTQMQHQKAPVGPQQTARTDV